MTRTDTLRAIANRCRSSHAASLLALGWLLVDETTETLESLLMVLEESKTDDARLDLMMQLEAILGERFGSPSRLGTNKLRKAMDA